MELKALNLSKDYSGKKAVDGVDISVISGHIIGLLGPNGAGKTTFFYMIAGLVASDSGQVLINDQDVTNESISERARKGLSYLPQEPSVFRRLSVKDNILAALEQRRDLNSKQKQEELYRLIKEFNLETLLEIKSIKLSGGERRRVEIARALASKPRFLLLDEPFAGIDPIAVSELKTTLEKLREMNIGILISDHNVRETMKICDKVLILSEGKAVAEGAPEEVSNNELVKEVYLGKDFHN
tara:strand:+ start:2151 stop:2873 length:723 start_codon:yes stop_codon:yes gene_type:complete